MNEGGPRRSRRCVTGGLFQTETKGMKKNNGDLRGQTEERAGVAGNRMRNTITGRGDTRHMEDDDDWTQEAEHAGTVYMD